jgi:hypothetical protein
MYLRVSMAICLGIMPLGCGGDDDGDDSSGGNVVNLTMDGGTSVDMGSGDSITDFCQRSATAKCTWVYMCVGAGYQVQSLFGLSGPSAEACVRQETSTCEEDLRDREARGTLAFTETAIDACIQQLDRAPCQRTPPVEWATQWHEFVANNCGRVAAGNVQPDGACERSSDCTGRHDTCIGNVCKTARAFDLNQSCTPSGTTATMAPSDECATGFCVNTGHGGNCTVDCRTGRGCVGDGLACLQLSSSAGPASAFCIATCSVDAHCGDLACKQFDPLDPMSETYCLTPDP